MRIALPAALAALALAACGGATDRSGLRARETAATPAAPGLVLELTGAEIAEGAAPVVTFRATDGAGAPIDLAAEIAAGAVAPRFVLARRLPGGAMSSYLVAEVAARPYLDAEGNRVEPASTATQAIADPPSGAAWPLARLASRGDGVWAYTFGAPVTGVDATATHLVGVWATRTGGNAAAPATATLDLVPAGGAPAPPAEVTEAACDRCHGRLVHHDERRGPKLCLACHTAQTSDPETGAPLDLTSMVHRIHKGARLAQPLVVVGDGQRLHDYGHVFMAPSHSTYLELTAKPASGPGTRAVNDPGIVRRCALCHEGTAADRWRTAPSARACGSCHDADRDATPPTPIDFATGSGHVVGGAPAPSSDDACARCHVASDDPGAAPPTAAVHDYGYETTRDHGFGAHVLEVRIDAVRDAVAGRRAQVDFTVRLDDQPLDLLARPLATLAFQIAGPVADYAEVIPTGAANLATNPPTWPTPSTSSALCGTTATSSCPTGSTGDGWAKPDPGKVTAIDAAAGRFTFTFPSSAAVPAGRTGTYVVSFEALYKERWVGPAGETISRPFAAHPVFQGSRKNVAYVDVATGAPSSDERRAVVSNEKCNACHQDLGFHSNRSRKGIDYCATCHAPGLDNRGRARFRASDTAPLAASGVTPPPGPVFVPESVASKVFIHRIHMGAELPSVKAGGSIRFGANRTASDATPGPEGLSDFSRFESPHPMSDCAACHLDGTWGLPDAPGLLPVRRAVLDCGETDAAGWCKGRTPNGVLPVLVTPPLKAVCTSCHDDAAAKAHADLNTVRPNSADAVESCASCHGAGRDFDARRLHAAP